MTWSPQWSIKNLPQGALSRTATMQVRAVYDSDAHAAQVANECVFVSGPTSLPRLAVMMTTNPQLIFAPYLKSIQNPAGATDYDAAATKYPNAWYCHHKDGRKAKQGGQFVNWLMETGFYAETQVAKTQTGPLSGASLTASSWAEFHVLDAARQIVSQNSAAANQGKHPWRCLWFDSNDTFSADATSGTGGSGSFWTGTNPGWNPHTLAAYTKTDFVAMAHWVGDMARNLTAAGAVNPERLFTAANGLRSLSIADHYDMAMAEGWMVSGGLGGPIVRTAGAHESDLQLALDCQLHGCVAEILEWGIAADTLAQVQVKRRFTAASNLIVNRGLITHEFSSLKNQAPHLETAKDPGLYALDLGTPLSGHSPSIVNASWPTGARVPVGASNGEAASVGLYGRLYDGGAVLQNITSSAINYKADRTYTSVPTLGAGTASYTAGQLVSVPTGNTVFLTHAGGSGSTAPVNVYLPSVLGTPREGQLMRVELGAYTSSPPATITDAWQQAGTPSGAGTAITSLTDGSPESDVTYSIPFGTGGTASVYASDAYGATVANGWGTADTGGAWSIELGGTADYAKASGTGTFSHSTANSGKFISLNTSLADLDTVITLAFSATPTGGNMQGSLCLRFADTSNYLRVNTNLFASGGHLFANPDKVISGVATSLGTSKDLGSYSAGAGVKLRLRLEGANVKAKAWLAAGTEPAPWDWDVTDSSISAAGKIVIRSFRGSGNTNTSPQTKADNLVASSLVGTVTGLAGKYLRVAELATNTAGSQAENSAYSAVIATGAMTDPIWTTLPTASGTPTEGLTLTSDPGVLTGTPTPTVSYQWETSADASPGSTSNISGETAATLVPASGTAGAYVRCNVQASNAGATVHQWTNWMGPIASGASGSAPAATTPPSISGSTVAGDTLTLDPGVWTGTPAPGITQQWQASIDSGATYFDLTGEQNLTYVEQSGDAGALISALVSATNASGTTVARATAVGPVTLPSDFPNLQLSVSTE